MDRNERRRVFEHTLTMVQEGQLEDLSGTGLKFSNLPQMKSDGNQEDTPVTVVNLDSFEAAEALLLSGSKPAVLNMANSRRPGGGVTTGASAQEESLCRRSNLITSLYTFVDHGENFVDDYLLDPDEHSRDGYSSPLNPWTVIYSPGVTVVKSRETYGCRKLLSPFKVDVISAAAPNHPDLDKDGNMIPAVVDRVKKQIRMILRTAVKMKNDAVVLGAFGCGAFACPAKHMAKLFHQVIDEDEFRGKFKNITFAILDDRNSSRPDNPDGNFRPFENEFSGL